MFEYEREGRKRGNEKKIREKNCKEEYESRVEMERKSECSFIEI